ncbi:aldose 1-epimerase [Gloeobacter kilaueensis]|uniref:Aldose-1-epimerase n=1 Tax=Gloeobacter kilaueensis (strain ATCC BAA-2537 / CCAP 1431/1 / ULC 316 / JS1) TaxID=1183438 RepID=U5QI68_GLOK1|nr:aldose 1-epimerase [Gloeobacter kilaueensis]AGY58687.1 aldose-1-epimerase [Gloeobacter kilaueensis JS1]
MFHIEREIGPFASCRLVDTETHAAVEIAPGRGGMVTGFRLAGHDLLYLDYETFSDPARSVRGGIPVLFPICANLAGDSYTALGRTYTLKQHGLARLLEWQVIEESTVGAAGLTLVLTSSEATLEHYPFPFELRFHYLLRGNELTIRQEYANLSDYPMPMYAGFHPYFACSDKSKLQFALPARHYVDQVSGNADRWQGVFPLDAPAVDWIFTDVNGQRATVTSPADGYRLTLEYDPLFAYLVFWTLQGKPFFCLEPWMAPRNALNTGDHLQHVPPGERLSAQISILGELL